MPTVSRNELAVLHNELCSKAREIMQAKNRDYAHEGDVFRNFRLFGGLGILVRLSDKLARLRSFEENQSFAVTDEKLIDTVLDTINYAVLYFAMKQEGRTQKESNCTQIASGPICDGGCGQLADFATDNNDAFWCANCAIEKGLDTTEMCVLEQVG